MRPRMWRDFTTSLRDTFAADLHQISEEQHACFHDIRTLAVGGKHVGHDYDARLSGLMCLLYDDQLLEFSSARQTPLNMMQLRSLLRHQMNLRSFQVRLDLSDTAIEDMAPWTTEQASFFMSALCSLTSLRIYVGDRFTDGDYHRALQNYEIACNGLLMKAAPLLHCLEICGWRQTWTARIDRIYLTAFLGNAANPKQFPSTLRHFLLADMDLSGAEKELTRAINIAALYSLKLESCDKYGPFLRTLAVSIRQTGATLKVLTIRGRTGEIAGDNEYINYELKDLLCSFAGLEELEFQSLWAGLIDWKACLRAHQTLKKLLVASPIMTDGHFSWTEKIAHILEQCPNLQYFAYPPTTPSLGYIASCQLPSKLPLRLYESLDVVAAFPTIRTLRMLYAPGFYEDRSNRQDLAWAEKAGQIAHRIATLVLTHLDLKGSNIKLLALSPSSRWKQVCADSNLQYYPHYYYRLQIVDLDGTKVIKAAPLRDYVAECPSAAIFM